MNSDSPQSAPETLDLAEVVRQMDVELRCLLGPTVHLTITSIPGTAPALVHARRAELVDLLRHLALDARDAMPIGGTLTIRTGRLQQVAECAALVLHEVPDAATPDNTSVGAPFRKGRSLGLNASYETIERAGGHFHVSCRGRETVLTICFPLAA